MLDKLNTTDIKILRLLQENSNRTIKNIADILGMTTTPVFERIKKLEKNHDIGEDDSKGYQDDIQKLTDSFIRKVEEHLVIKEAEIMKV